MFYIVGEGDRKGVPSFRSHRDERVRNSELVTVLTSKRLKLNCEGLEGDVGVIRDVGFNYYLMVSAE